MYIDSRERLEPQISTFAQKLTSKDFTFDRRTGHFQKVSGKGLQALDEAAGKVVYAPAKGLQMTGELVGMVPVIGKPLEVAFSLSGKAASLVGEGAKKLEKGISELSRAGRLAHQGLLETIKQVQRGRQMEKTASKQKGAELEI